jgi:hypothetical protein
LIVIRWAWSKDFLPDSSILVAILRLIDFLRLLVIPSLSLFGRDSTPPCPTDYDQAFSSLGPTTNLKKSMRRKIATKIEESGRKSLQSRRKRGQRAGLAPMPNGLRSSLFFARSHNIPSHEILAVRQLQHNLEKSMRRKIATKIEESGRKSLQSRRKRGQRAGLALGRDSTPPCPTDYDQAFSSLGPTTSPAMRF